MLSKYFVPDVFFDNIYQITPQYLKNEGIEALILDIDNTLVTYSDPKPTKSLLDWFEKMKEAGISIALVSNNHKKRVRIFNEELGFFAAGMGNKPFCKHIRRAMAHMNATPDKTALVGDQILTDILAGKRAKLRRAYLVRPINDKTGLFTRTKRAIEKPYIKKYENIQKGEK
ncbi:MAG: YqeG family HAD IIIA-type phosphatase, partial [Clostridia bacterium]|nr:YqeG family HAD IIIA-type phosphatase [Clostridia bacterium]